jgi:hypothetical protein
MVFIVSAPYSHILNSDYQNSDFMQVAFSRSESPKPDSRRKRRFPNQPVNLSTYQLLLPRSGIARSLKPETRSPVFVPTPYALPLSALPQSTNY